MRTIVRSHGFDDAASQIVGSIRLADEAIRGLEWMLSREPSFESYPSLGMTTHGTLYAYKTAPIGAEAVDSLVVYFTADDTTAHLHSIRRSASTDDLDID